ncbi:hypothetical protein GLP43_16015 [Sulfitobacter sp. M39]|uniref:hypothetical protein n=1 Tax=Sulfitobacter sp. M39 TaxID=2675334 RepID=UPI001F3D79E9|nr:hypothetical protein [Sulfitobacter sp. M39]MCF7749060.1 hypothetical protein [Sulfitobacter sp. M39]
MNPKKGNVRLSLDFECGWGVAQGGGWRRAEASGVYRNLRPALRRFTQRLEELELSFTWAVVGGMIEDPHARDLSHLRGAFDRDMKTFLAEAEDFTVDGRDLLDMVTNLKTKQTFATHTYSHLLFSDPEQDINVVTEDLTRAIAVNTRLGLDASRLVFPRNHVGHIGILKDLGITHVRMPPANSKNPTARIGALKRGLALMARPVAVVTERVDETGIVCHHASELLNWGVSASVLKRKLIQRRRKLALEEAVRGGDIHFWVHPFDLVQTKGLEGDIFAMLTHIANLREQSVIDVGGF